MKQEEDHAHCRNFIEFHISASTKPGCGREIFVGIVRNIRNEFGNHLTCSSSPKSSGGSSGGGGGGGGSAAVEEMQATSFSTTVAGKHYSGSVQDTNGEYVATAAGLAGASASGSSLSSAENNLTTRIDELV